MTKLETSQSKEKIQFPDFDSIIMHCKTLMSLKFPQYGNSWVTTDYDMGFYHGFSSNRFWENRLKGEVEEFLKAKTVAEAKKELADIINVCSMIYEKCIATQDPNWRYG